MSCTRGEIGKRASLGAKKAEKKLVVAIPLRVRVPSRAPVFPFPPKSQIPSYHEPLSWSGGFQQSSFGVLIFRHDQYSMVLKRYSLTPRSVLPYIRACELYLIFQFCSGRITANSEIAVGFPTRPPSRHLGNQCPRARGRPTPHSSGLWKEKTQFGSQPFLTTKSGGSSVGLVLSPIA